VWFGCILACEFIEVKVLICYDKFLSEDKRQGSEMYGAGSIFILGGGVFLDYLAIGVGFRFTARLAPLILFQT